MFFLSDCEELWCINKIVNQNQIIMSIVKKENEKGGIPTTRTRLDDLFDFESFFSTPFFDPRSLGNWGNSWPSANVKESDTAFSIELAAPGLNKEDFSLDVHDGVLDVTAESKTEATGEADNYTRREYSYSSFKRSFQLPEEVEVEKVGANYENGVLNITLPKKAGAVEPQRKQIQIQ